MAKTNAKADIGITSWDESPYAEFDDGEKLTTAIVTSTYTGDVQGESRAHSLMYYGVDGAPVHYTGLERFTCTVGGRSGSFVAQTRGVFSGGTADTTWFVVPGSGLGELRGLRGAGASRAVSGRDAVSLSFDYEFEG